MKKLFDKIKLTRFHYLYLGAGLGYFLNVFSEKPNSNVKSIIIISIGLLSLFAIFLSGHWDEKDVDSD